MGIRVKQGDLVTIKLKDDLYSIAFAVEDVARQYFDIKSKDGNWDTSKPIKLTPLFTTYGGKSTNSLVVKKLNPDDFIFDKEVPDRTLWIRPYVNSKGGFHLKGGDLISVEPGKDYFDAPIIKENLKLPEDRELIESHELVNMWGPNDMKERLIRYFEKGIDRDDLKFEVFPGLWNDREKLRPLTSRLPDPLR